MADVTNPTPRPSLSAIKSVWGLIAGVWLVLALIDPARLGEIFGIATGAFLNTLPFILFAVLLIAGLKATGSETLISRAFEGRERRAIVLAALFGGLAPFCSCEVIPFIAALLAAGTPLSAVMAFWLASPLIDPPTLLITAGALGWPFAIAKAVAAVAIGLMGGFAVLTLTRAGALANVVTATAPKSCCGAPKLDAKPVWRFWGEPARVGIFKDTFFEQAIFLTKWLLLAYTLEALLIVYVPEELVAATVGGEGFWPIVVSAFVGMPAYINSYVAPPLLAGLTEQGMQAGAALSFMVAGAVSSIPAMAAVWALVARRVFALYIGLGISGAILSGVVFQLLQ
ncbi:MAG: permease [Pseudomonadota bacterium]